MAEIEVRNNPEETRYEAWIDGELAGFAEYLLPKAMIVFSHTEVGPEFEGQGVGSALARYALDDVQAEGGRRVLPLCPFIKAWIDRHPDYLLLVHTIPPSTAKD